MRALFLPESVRRAREVTEKYSSSYSLAIRLFPSEIRGVAYILYAYFREIDEIADSGLPDAHQLLAQKRELWRQAYVAGICDDQATSDTATLFQEYLIPADVMEGFFEAMQFDVEKREIRTRRDLTTYAKGAAGTVGIAMTYIIGFRETTALVCAEKLGVAVQITNILRDVRQDNDELGRIYLPLADRERFGVTIEDIRAHRVTPAFKYLIHDLAHYNHLLYKEAVPGIELLNSGGRIPVRLAARISEGILDQIDRNEYDIFTHRARVPSWKKGMLLLSAAGSEAWARLRSSLPEGTR